MADMNIESGTGSKILQTAQKRLRDLKESKNEKEFRERGIEELKYFTGEDQGWDKDGARAKLIEEKRPAITLNRIAPIVRLMCGARPQTEAKYFAVEDGDVQTAATLNSCKTHIEDFNKWEFEASDWFLRGIVLNRWGVEIRPNYRHDPRGEIEYRTRDGFEFYLSDSKKKDRSDMPDMIEFQTVPIDEAKRAFPDHKTKIDELVGYVKGGEVTESRDSGEPDEYTDSRANYYDAASGMITVPRYWYKEYERRTKIIDLAEGEIWDSPKSEKELRKEIGEISTAPERFHYLEYEKTTVRYITWLYDVELEEGVTPWEREDGQPTTLSENFPFIFFEPERIVVGARNEIISIINPLEDPQKFHNKLASAILEIIGTSPKEGVDYEKDAIEPEWKEILKSQGARAGAAIEWKKGALTEGKVKYRQHTANPQAEMMEAKEMAGALLDISGVESLVSTKELGKAASGIAIDLKQRQGGNIISWVYVSFRYFQHILAQYTLDAIQVLYDYHKIIRIRGTKPKYVEINQPVYDDTGEISEILNDVTIGKYDLSIADKELMPSMRLERFRYFTELVKSGSLPLPPEVLVKVVLHLLDDPELKEVVQEEMETFEAAMMPQGQQPGQMPAQMAR